MRMQVACADANQLTASPGGPRQALIVMRMLPAATLQVLSTIGVQISVPAPGRCYIKRPFFTFVLGLSTSNGVAGGKES